MIVNRRFFHRLSFRILGLMLLACLLGAAASWALMDLVPDSRDTFVLRRAGRRTREAIEHGRDPEVLFADLHRVGGIRAELFDERSARVPAATRTGNIRGRSIIFVGRRAYVHVNHAGTHKVMSLELEDDLDTSRSWFFWGVVIALLLLSVSAWFAHRIVAPIQAMAEVVKALGQGNLSVRMATEVGPTRLAAAGSEIVQLAQRFDWASAQLERSKRDQDLLLGAIAHELRGPLARASLAVATVHAKPELQDGSAASEERQATLLRAIEEIQRSSSILEELLASTRLSIADLKLADYKMRDVVLAAIAEEPMPPVIEFDEDASIPEDLTVTIDKELWTRALTNLFRNARKHGHPENEPIVVACRQGKFMTIEVRDAGPGFPAHLLEGQLQPFTRGADAAENHARTPRNDRKTSSRSSQRDQQGLGLGLVLTARIAEAHGGYLQRQNILHGDKVVGASVTLAVANRQAIAPKVQKV
jgi:signal transduction histidine kinase